MAGRAELRWSQLRVGIVVAIAVAIIVFVIFAATGGAGWFASRMTLYTYVPDAGGMRPGASVNLEGVAIGNVTAVQLAEHPPDPNNPVEVTMQVSEGHERWLRTNSTVELGTAGPLGETLVNIAGGTLAAPPARNGTILPGAPSTGINQLLVSSHDLITNANLLEQRLGDMLDQIQNGKGSIGKLLYSSELYDRFNSTALNLQHITAKLNSGEGTAGKLLSDTSLYDNLNTTLGNLNALINTVEHGNGTAAHLLNDPALYNNLNQTVASLHQTITALNAGHGALGALMTDSATSAKLKDSLARLDALLQALQSGQGTAGKLLHDETLYNNLNSLTVEVRQLMQAIRANPKKYLTIHLDIF